MHFVESIHINIIFNCVYRQKCTKIRYKYTIVSYDCVQLYTNVNTKMVVNFMLDLIYENPAEYYNEGYNIVD